MNAPAPESKEAVTLALRALERQYPGDCTRWALETPGVLQDLNAIAALRHRLSRFK